MKIQKIKINENTLVFENDYDMARFRKGDKDFQIDMSECHFGKNGIYYATPKSPFWFEINPAEDIAIYDVKNITCNYDTLSEKIIIVVYMQDGLEHIFYIDNNGVVDYTRHRSEKEKSLLELCKEKYIVASENHIKNAEIKFREFVEKDLLINIERFGGTSRLYNTIYFNQFFQDLPFMLVEKAFIKHGFKIISENGLVKISGWAE